MKRMSVLCVSMLAIAGCTTTGGSDAATAAMIARYDAKLDACQKLKTPPYTAKTQCLNEADELLAATMGGDDDLIYYRIANRTELGERLDKKQITPAQVNAELARITAQITTERNRRLDGRMQVVMQIMQNRSNATALQSMARSQSRMADALDVSGQPRYINGQRNPYSWASDYARQ